MFYRNHVDQISGSAISTDSDSFDLALNSPVTSPTIDEDTIFKILKPNSGEVKETGERRRNRDKFKKLFRTISWRHKNTRKNVKLPNTKTNKVENAFQTENIYDDNDDDTAREFSLLNKSLKPSEKEAEEEFIKDGDKENENVFEIKSFNTLPISINSKESLLTETNGNLALKRCKTDSPKNTLSRKISKFSTKNKSKNKNGMYDLSDAPKYFNDIMNLSDWRVDNFRKPNLILNRSENCFNSKKANYLDENIYLFLNNKNKEFEFYKNLDKMVYYPYTKEIIEKSFLYTFNYSRINKESIKFLKDKKMDANIEFEVNSKNGENNAISKLSVKSLKLPEIIEFNRINNNKNLNSFNEINYLIKQFNVKDLINIQMGKNHMEPIKIWNLWLMNNDKGRERDHTKFTIFMKIFEYSQIKKLEEEFQTLLDYYIYNKNRQIFLLKSDELPIFHGKHKNKSYGEYVYIIPINSSKDIWISIINLLITEQLNWNFPAYEVIGICWRRYKFKDNVGFHLTLYVDDRANFEEKKMILFLNDILVLIPEKHKHCFKKCKTVFPNETCLRIVEIN